ncbi:hypothetical protein EAC17_06370 [Enterococcus faecium]|nr:hypothetical protein CVT45_01965 [Enterococcus faecium Com15]EGP5280203.1 hypothetical protein [Enterococcus faecium]EEV62967.1 predicted protein [Enterococcus faecium Com15]EGP5394324.1 hypothetical protein [Enterococcus faecium]EGP5400435.1 hypothetical protein [Enterococcus faecium]
MASRSATLQITRKQRVSLQLNNKKTKQNAHSQNFFVNSILLSFFDSGESKGETVRMIKLP